MLLAKEYCLCWITIWEVINYRVPKPGLVLEEGKWAANIQFPGMPLRYTTDGKDPNIKSMIYKDPVPAAGKTLQCRAFDSRGRGGAIAGE